MINKATAEYTFEQTINRLEDSLGIRSDFLKSLIKEDDWSFVIKLHALIEAAVSHLLTETLGKKELLETISRLELSNKSFGKMAFVKALNLLDHEDRKFISSLSELRNDLVHNVANVDFNLDNYLKRMTPEGFSNFVKNLIRFQ